MRMLEREFGPESDSGKWKGQEFMDSEGRPLVGTVDDKGYIITQGPRKRLSVRALQIVLSLGAAIPSIYAALVRASFIYT